MKEWKKPEMLNLETKYTETNVMGISGGDGGIEDNISKKCKGDNGINTCPYGFESKKKCGHYTQQGNICTY